MKVKKRNGQLEELDYEKINKVLAWATEDINGVSASEVAMNANLKWEDNISTRKIHEELVATAAEMISEESPNYQYVAANLLNYYLRKEVFGVIDNLPRLYDVIKMNVDRGIYHPMFLEKYTEEEIDKIDKFVKHKRDNDFTYAGLQQLADKYLQKNRNTGELHETVQYMYVLIAMYLFIDTEDRVNEVRSFYDMISKHIISLPTPIMAGVRTLIDQFSSCTLIDIGDTMDSIVAGDSAVSKYTAMRAGIGINSRIRAVNDPIRNGEVIHTGLIPFFKKFEASVKSCQQNGIRGGSATTYVPFWHLEIEDVIRLKNNKGTEENRVRKLDYCVQLTKIFLQRFKDNENITLFSPNDVKDMYDAFGYDDDKFEKLYLEYENNPDIRKKSIPAREFMQELSHERFETGRIYIMFIDNANRYSSFEDKVWMSNLCTEINLITSPINHIDDGKIIKKDIIVYDEDKFEAYKKRHNGLYVDGNNMETLINDDEDKGFDFWDPLVHKLNDTTQYKREDFELQFGDEPAEIALCVLAAVNCGKIKDLDDLEEIMYSIVHALDKVIDLQSYPIHAAKKMLKRRSIGIGLTNFAYYLAKRGVKYNDPEALKITHEFMESFQYYAIKASVELAKKYGPCEWFHRTKYAKGILPVDNYKKTIDELVEPNYRLDWDKLREDVLKYGMRNSTLTAIMPCESSSLVTNSTNGIEPPRDKVTTKQSKARLIKMVLPELQKLKNKYTYAFDMEDNYGYLNITAIIGKFIDQGISANQYYNVNHYENGVVPLENMMREIFHFYKYGGKQLYYANTYDGKTDEFDIVTDCAGGACSI